MPFGGFYSVDMVYVTLYHVHTMRFGRFFMATTTVNMLLKQMLMDEALPFQPKYKRRRLTTEERLKNYSGNYKTEEWDTGEPVGREVF